MQSTLMMPTGSYVDRGIVATIPTPVGTNSWRPVAHIDVVNMLTDTLHSRGLAITGEQFGLAREGQQLFGVLEINKTGSPEWKRCIGIRNSHDKSLSVGLTAGIMVCVCSNLAFGGSTVIKRRHSSRIEVAGMIGLAVDTLENEFKTIEAVAHQLKRYYIADDDARRCLVRAAETDAIPSCDIMAVFDEFKKPQHNDFREPTRWSLLNAFTQTAKKYTPQRADKFHRELTKLFGLNGLQPALWAS